MQYAYILTLCIHGQRRMYAHPDTPHKQKDEEKATLDILSLSAIEAVYAY